MYFVSVICPLAQLPGLERRGSAVVVAQSKCACLSLFDSNVCVFTYRALGSLLHRLQSIYIVFGASDSPDMASTRPYDLVSHLAGTDTSRLQFCCP